AGAVSSQEGAYLAGLDDQVDLVVGDQALEALRDAAQLKFHRQPPSSRFWSVSPAAPGTPTSLTVTSCLVPWLHGTLGGRNELAADDRRLHRRELGLELRGDLARPGVDRCQHGPAVGQRAAVASA